MVHFLEPKMPHMYISLLQLRSKCSGGYKNPTTSEIELFETVLNFWKPPSFVAKGSVLNLAGFLYLPLIRYVFKLCNIKHSNNGADEKSKIDLQ